MQLDYPFDFGPRRRTATTTDDEHIRDLIEQLLFTAPGERVNRPTLGSGLLRLVFEGNDDTLAAMTRAGVEGTLQQWLGELIVLEAVRVRNDDATLTVEVQYVVRRTQQREVVRVSQPAGAGGGG